MDSIRKGFSSLPSHSIKTALDFGGEYGFDFVELRMGDYNRTAITAHTDEIGSLLDENELDLLVHLPYGKKYDMIGSSDSSIRENSVEMVKEYLRTARKISAEKAVLHIDSNKAPLLLEQEQVDPLVNVLTELNDFSRSCGIELCIENMLNRRPDPDDLSTLANRTDISLTFDTGHARTTGYNNDDIVQFVNEHADIISHFHLNDTRKPKDEHLPFGAGTIDFERLFEALPNNWEGTLGLEIKTSDYDYIAFSGQKLNALL